MISETLEAERAYHKGLSEEYYRGYRAAKDEIVHCEDCKHYLPPHACLHDDGMITAQEDGFCSYGEEKG